MKKRTITIGIILLSIILLLYLYFDNRNGVAPQCPQGCRCGAGDPMIPDAPRKCIAE